jgi:hypothetical protein
MRITETKFRIAVIFASFVVVGCAPTFESHIDSPPAFDSQTAQQCPPIERPGLNTEKRLARDAYDRAVKRVEMDR